MALVIFLFVSMFADAEVHLLASSAYAGAEVAVPYLFMGALLFGVYIFAPGLTIARRTRTMAAITASAGALNLVLAILLVPGLGIRGAGLATAISSAWFFVLIMVASQRHYPVPHDWPRLLAAFVVALGVLVLGHAVIPSGGNGALAAGPLAEKALLSLVGSGLIAMLLVRRSEIAGLRRSASERSGQPVVDLE
jgi:O-antigen/teichoic acid export membrane protein